MNNIRCVTPATCSWNCSCLSSWPVNCSCLLSLPVSSLTELRHVFHAGGWRQGLRCRAYFAVMRRRLSVHSRNFSDAPVAKLPAEISALEIAFQQRAATVPRGLRSGLGDWTHASGSGRVGPGQRGSGGARIVGFGSLGLVGWCRRLRQICPVCLCVVCLFVCLFVCLSVCHLTLLSVRSSVCLPIRL